MLNQKSVLLIAYQPDQLAPHAQAFAESGFQVDQASSLSAALGAVGPGRVALAIFAPGIPAGDRRRVEGEAKRRNHEVKIVLLYDGEKERDVFASAILAVETAPSYIVQVANQLLEPGVLPNAS